MLFWTHWNKIFFLKSRFQELFCTVWRDAGAELNIMLNHLHKVSILMHNHYSKPACTQHMINQLVQKINMLVHNYRLYKPVSDELKMLQLDITTLKM